jgi:hypothetical protein
MAFDLARARNYLQAFDLPGLFTQCLGWDRFRVQSFEIDVEGSKFRLEPVAEKCGFAVLTCCPCDTGEIPDYPFRRKIEQRVRKLYHEHVVIFKDRADAEQKWLWVRREPGKPAVGREYTYVRGQPGDALLQRVQELGVELDDELKGLVITDMVGRVGRGFDRDKVSRKFFDRFKDEHARFLKFLKGIPDEAMQRWYASVMLNRLMFIYFIEKKGFLNGDQDYLKHKLAEAKQRGKDRFYPDFLCPLFFEGFAKRAAERSKSTQALLGNVPYLNGGIFMPHQIEQQCGKSIEIPDSAFDKLFAFFDDYRWHLDERPLRADNEINPDVLGYIFEKYINQKQMGAYYTKEDITEYIGRNTIVPRLLDMARQKCKVAFEGESSVWRYLQQNPDRYIFEPVRRGVIAERGHDRPLRADRVPGIEEDNIIPESCLPDFVQKGMHDPKARMFEKRYNLGDAELLDDKGKKQTLPTETWREYVARRERCLELRRKLANGEVRDINDLITLNLDIRQFAQDVVEGSDPDLLRAIWRAIAGRIPDKSNEEEELGISVLDPTCGSGAFLFAALNILLPIYKACLVGMRGFLEELDKSGAKHSPKKYDDFWQVIERVDKHRGNEDYFILKTIVLRNLFGVDIMDEAVEICKLRLFLKLVAQMDRVEDIEPLPDIDFNIRAGNTLVGYATYDQVKKALSSKLDFEGAMEKIEEKAQEVERLAANFRLQQTELGGEVTEQDKANLQKRLAALDAELNRHLSREYGVDNKKPGAYDRWLKSHKPFHWFVEFYGIMKGGGFDVIVGNPPYVETKDVSEYRTSGYATEECGDLYALVVERSHDLARRQGRCGMIVPVSIVSTDGFGSLRSQISGRTTETWFSSYAERPSKLFTGVEKRLTILLANVGHSGSSTTFVSGYRRWLTEEREALMACTRYVTAPPGVALVSDSVPKVSTEIEVAALNRLSRQPRLGSQYVPKSPHTVYYTRKLRYFAQFFDFVPKITVAGGKRVQPSELKEMHLNDGGSRDLAIAALNSSAFFWFLTMFSDMRNLNRREVQEFRFGLKSIEAEPREAYTLLARRLMSDFDANSVTLTNDYGEHGVMHIQSFQPRLSKPIVDKIDRLLSKHYGFTDEELDFIINYDIKYRMGRGAGSDE